MSTTWGQYTWGSNSWESDLNTIVPSSNTITTSVSSVTAFPEQGWGGKQWGINEWGELSDVTVSLTGQELTSSLGTETVEAILNRGWGRKNWGEEAWGIGGSVLPDGQQLQTTLASVTVTNEINIGWGGLAWGIGEWGDLANPDIIQTGIAMTSNTQDVSITADANVDATGSEATTGTDGAVGGTSVDLQLVGEELTSATDGVFAGELVTVELTSPSNDPWGNTLVGWGNGLWGVGDGVTILGDAVVDLQGNANVIPTGAEATGQTGDLGQASIYEFTSATATTIVGDAFGGEVVEIQVTTASAQPWGETSWGDGEWGQSVGTDIAIGADAVLIPSIDVPVTGEQLDWTIGVETVKADANVTLSGLSAEVFQGDENAFTDVNVQIVSYEQNNITIGNFVAGISQLVVPTGVTATTNVGTMGINAWAVIEPNASTTWSVVDKAAA